MSDKKIDDEVEYKGKKGKITQIIHTPVEVKYLVKFEDGSEEQISLGGNYNLD